MKRVMIDLECLSLRSDAAIVAIGVAISDDRTPEAPPSANAWFIDPDLALGHRDVSTIEWWANQDPEIREKVLRGNLNPIEALSGFCRFLQENDCNGGTDKEPREDVLIYGDPSMYDLPILGYLFRSCGIVKPWGYRQEQDARTIRKVVTDILQDSFEESSNWMPHHPMHDAITQLKDLNRLISILREYR